LSIILEGIIVGRLRLITLRMWIWLLLLYSLKINHKMMID